MAWGLLAIAFAAIGFLVATDVRRYERFKALTDTRTRQQTYVGWLGIAVLLFLAMPLAGLALLGRLEALVRFPTEFAALSLPRLGLTGGDTAILGGIFVGALLAGGILGGVAAARHRTPKPLGDIEPLMPRNGAETWRAGLLGLNAGIAEELFFRLYLPLLLVGVGVAAPV